MWAFTFATLALSLLPLFADATPLHPGTADVASQMESSSLNSRASFVAPSNGTQLYWNTDTHQSLTVTNVTWLPVPFPRIFHAKMCISERQRQISIHDVNRKNEKLAIKLIM
jgi:hypothetical protein